MIIFLLLCLAFINNSLCIFDLLQLILDTNKVAKVELLKDEKESEYLIKTAMAIMSSKDRCKRMRNLHAVRKGVRKGRRNDVKKSKRAAAEQYSST